MEREEQGKDICDRVDQLIDTDDEFLNNKTKIYCEYCLSLDKKYVDSITDDLYEECENYLKNYSGNKEKEKQFIKSYQSVLAKEGKEICAEFDSILCDNEEFVLDKSLHYCYFFKNLKLIEKSIKYKIDSNLLEKSIKYLNDLYSFRDFKHLFEDNLKRKKFEKENKSV